MMKKEEMERHQNNPLSCQYLMRGWQAQRELARLARRKTILEALAPFPRLRDGMVAAGVSWPTLVGMMRHKGFKAELRKIITAHRAAGAIQRRRKERVAVWVQLQKAGLPKDVAYVASHQVVDPRPPDVLGIL